jgi:hypothetical protein
MCATNAVPDGPYFQRRPFRRAVRRLGVAVALVFALGSDPAPAVPMAPDSNALQPMKRIGDYRSAYQAAFDPLRALLGATPDIPPGELKTDLDSPIADTAGVGTSQTLIEIQALDSATLPGQPAARTPGRGPDGGGRDQRTGAVSAADLIRFYINVQGTGPATATGTGIGASAATLDPGSVNPDDGALGQGLITALLDSALDSEFVQDITAFVQPEVDTEGQVTFSIEGLGSFAMIFNRATNALTFLDVNTGRAFQVAPPRATGGAARLQAAELDDRTPGLDSPKLPVGPQRNMRVVVIDFVYQTAQEPLVVGAILLAIMLWVLWRVTGREI